MQGILASYFFALEVHNMSQILVNNLTFNYENSYDNIFEKVSFSIDTDWKLGFIGRNGRGKTTFLQLLMGKYEYDGNITANVNFDYFPYIISEDLMKEDTIQVIDYMDSNYELWKICRELNLMHMEGDLLYRPFATLSNGERTKVMLAVLFSKDNNFLLIDEPTNHLDLEARENVRDYLKLKKGFILVSHDRWILDACINHVLVINKTNITVEQGNFSTWWENKQRQDEYELSENIKLKKDISRLSEAAKRAEGWSDQIEKSKIGSHAGDRGFIGHKSAKMMKRAKSIENRMENAIEEKSKLLKNIETTSELKIIPLVHHKEVLIEAKECAIYYGDKQITENVDFKLIAGDRMVLSGSNGCGKSSIIKKILGDNINSTGELSLASGLKISYVSQDTSHLKGTLKDFAEDNQMDMTLFKTMLRKLDFERTQFEKNMETYSAGQKKKVLLAKSLCEQAHVYIWDEPLNYIDLFSRLQIEELVLEFKPTMLFVEHDKAFVDKVSTKIVNIERRFRE